MYGVTTVPQRRKTYLPTTLASLKLSGFDKPRLFVDGDNDWASWHKEFNLEVTCRYPTIRTYGNWMLAMGELYAREPNADRYMIFQDDMVTYRNLKPYLEKVNYPDKGYCNLYTFPKNQERFPRIGRTARFRGGWWMSNQRGWGAVALMFSREALIALLTHNHMIERAQDVRRGHRSIDGGIVTSMNKAGWKEYVHNPTLVQHIGLLSSMRNNPQPFAESFKGEDFDAMELLKED